MTERKIDTIVGIIIIVLLLLIPTVVILNQKNGSYNDGEKLKIVFLEKEYDAIVLSGNKNNIERKVTVGIISKDCVTVFEVWENTLNTMIKKAP